jgi:hypothetical protein
MATINGLDGPDFEFWWENFLQSSLDWLGGPPSFPLTGYWDAQLSVNEGDNSPPSVFLFLHLLLFLITERDFLN